MVEVGDLRGPRSKRGRPRIQNIWERHWWKYMYINPWMGAGIGGELSEEKKHALQKEVSEGKKHALEKQMVRPWLKEDREEHWLWTRPDKMNVTHRVNGRQAQRNVRYHLYEEFLKEEIHGWDFALTPDIGRGCPDECVNPWHMIKENPGLKLNRLHYERRVEKSSMELPLRERIVRKHDGSKVLAGDWADEQYAYAYYSSQVCYNWNYEQGYVEFDLVSEVQTGDVNVDALLKRMITDGDDPVEVAKRAGVRLSGRDLKYIEKVSEVFADARDRGVRPESEQLYHDE